MQNLHLSTRTSQRGNSQPHKGTFDLWMLWLAFRRHWAWCIPLGLLIAAIGSYGVWNTFEPEYEATHLLEVNRDYVVFRGLDDLSQTDFARNERQLIMNGLVLDPVLADPSLKAAPSLSDSATAEREIRKRLNVTNGGTQKYLLINYRDTDPIQAANVCNAVAESYQRIRDMYSEQRVSAIVEWLMPAIDQWKREVELKRRTISELTKASSGYDPFKPVSSLESDASKLSELRGRLAELEAEEAVIQARIKALQSSNGQEESRAPNPEDVRRYIDADRDVALIRAKLDDKVATLRELERKEQQQMLSSRYKRVKAEAAAAEVELDKAEAIARDKAIETLSKLAVQKTAEDRRQQLRDLEFQLVNVNTKREAYTADYMVEKARVEKLGGETAEIFFAKEDYEQSAEILSQLNKRLAHLKTEQRRSSEIVSIATAKPPTVPIEDLPYKRIGLVSLAGLCVPFAIALLLELRFKRVVSSDHLEQDANLPVIGEIARLTGGPGNGRSQRMFEESIDALWANLSFRLEGIRTITITSAMPSEGKSSVASQLAIAMAKASEEPVLLIDADTRLPALHSLFGIEASPGFAKVIRGELPIESAIDTSLGSLVHVLPAGRLTCSPHQLVSRKNVEALLAKLPTQYRYVVIDTAPVLPAAETLAIASATDATLLCAMRDVTRAEHLQRAQRKLEAAGAKMLGIVFSGIPRQQYYRRYGSYDYAYRVPSAN